MNQTIVYQITAEDLYAFLSNIASKAIPGCEGLINANHEQENKAMELGTRTEVCEYLHISYPAFHSLVKRGAITPIKVGTRTLCDMNQIRADVKAGRLGRYVRIKPKLTQEDNPKQ